MLTQAYIYNATISNIVDGDTVDAVICDLGLPGLQGFDVIRTIRERNPAAKAGVRTFALVSLLGLTHVERNGHHYVNGMAGLPRHEQDADAARGGRLDGEEFRERRVGEAGERQKGQEEAGCHLLRRAMRLPQQIMTFSLSLSVWLNSSTD